MKVLRSRHQYKGDPCSVWWIQGFIPSPVQDMIFGGEVLGISMAEERQLINLELRPALLILLLNL